MSQLVYTIIWVISILQVLIGGIKSASLPDKEWWETTLVYQIWPRGFYDSDGDGNGDLKGIITKLDYIESLGVETIWLNPIYASPLVDAGYDVSNHTDINPLFGNFEDFDKLVEELHKRELKIILDVIPNHSSDTHEWFLLSIQNVPPYNDYYIWANGSVDGDGNKIPPNNWVSTYSKEDGSAWTWNDVRQQWYYHKFHESQPDFNLRNENVIYELMNIFKFWLERNIDGFRIAAVPYFFEDKDLQDESIVGSGHRTSGLHESIELLYKFRIHINNWVEENNAKTKLLIAESYDSDNNLIAYYGNATHEGIPPINTHFINPIHNRTDADYIKNVIDDWFQLLPEDATTNWMLSNHDFSRVPSRIGLNRVDGLHMLSLLLPGQAYTYYGEEIAMLDAKIPWDKTIDPMGCAQTEDTYESFSRDPARTPMQWNAQTSAGFSTNETTYLPVHNEYTYRNVEIQQTLKRSNFNTYKKLTKLRKDPVFTHGNYELQPANNNRILIMKRSLEGNPTYIVIVNLWIRRENIDLTSLYPDISNDLEIVVASSNALHIKDTVPKDKILLTANAALVLKGKIETDEPIVPSETTTEVNNVTGDTVITDAVTEDTVPVNTDTTDTNTKDTDTTDTDTKDTNTTDTITTNTVTTDTITTNTVTTDTVTTDTVTTDTVTTDTVTVNPTNNTPIVTVPTSTDTITINSTPTTDVDIPSTPTQGTPTTTERPETEPTLPATSTTPSIETTTKDNSATTNISTFLFILSTSFIVTILSRFLTV